MVHVHSVRLILAWFGCIATAWGFGFYVATLAIPDQFMPVF